MVAEAMRPPSGADLYRSEERVLPLFFAHPTFARALPNEHRAQKDNVMGAQPRRHSWTFAPPALHRWNSARRLHSVYLAALSEEEQVR